MQNRLFSTFTESVESFKQNLSADTIKNCNDTSLLLNVLTSKVSEQLQFSIKSLEKDVSFYNVLKRTGKLFQLTRAPEQVAYLILAPEALAKAKESYIKVMTVLEEISKTQSMTSEQHAFLSAYRPTFCLSTGGVSRTGLLFDRVLMLMSPKITSQITESKVEYKR